MLAMMSIFVNWDLMDGVNKMARSGDCLGTLFLGGPLHFSWGTPPDAGGGKSELSPEISYQMNGKVYQYYLLNLLIGPAAGENSYPIKAPAYMLDGYELTSRTMPVVRAAILRRYNFI